MKRLYTLFALAFIMIAGCIETYTEIGTERPEDALQPMTFSASVFEDPDVKAEIDAFLNINWSKGDKIGIFDGTAFREFTLKKGEGTTSAVFEGEAASAASYIAVYPYNKNLAMGPDGKIIGLSVPRVQTAGECPVIMTAECKDGGNSFAFKNALAYVKVSSIFPCHKIVLETYGTDETDGADSGRDLCGEVELELESGSAHVVGNPDNHVILCGDIVEGHPYFVAVAPRCLDKGFMVVLDALDDGLQYARKSEKHPELQRGHVLNLGGFSKTSTEWTRVAHLAPCDHGNAIYDWKDVTRIATCCESKDESSSIYFMSDIDFGDRILVPMSLEMAGDNAVYIYGNGHKITNYMQGCADIDGVGCAGMFVVKNMMYLKFYDLSLYPNPSEASSGGYICGGAFVAKYYGTYGLKFYRCKVSGNVSVKCTGNAPAYAGGFVGMANFEGQTDDIMADPCLVMEDCLMEGSVTAYSEDDIAYAGGFVGFMDAPKGNFENRITRCRNRAAILAKGDDDSAQVSGLDGIAAGGIVGCDLDRFIASNYSDGNVILELNSCVNEGSVTAEAMDDDNAFAGGMIGCHNSDGLHPEYHTSILPYVRNCFNRGSIIAISKDSDDNAAGMVGYCYNDDTSFRNCVNSGELSGNVCAHISGTKGSYSGICYWTKADSLPGIHDRYDHGQYTSDRMSGYKTDLAVTDLHPEDGESCWILRDGHLDLDIVR